MRVLSYVVVLAALMLTLPGCESMYLYQMMKNSESPQVATRNPDSPHPAVVAAPSPPPAALVIQPVAAPPAAESIPGTAGDSANQNKEKSNSTTEAITVFVLLCLVAVGASIAGA